ncbi:hypothetical protein BDR06DRAFT_1032526 [Suillus hirtellus]|nr:hypothetical protein BDR06DRAFT_1032526 [Suillus hirtellus]
MSVSAYTCMCKRTFTTQNHFSQHQHSCLHTKKCLSSAISSLKEFVSRRKRVRTSCNDNSTAEIVDSPILSSNLSAYRRPPSGEARGFTASEQSENCQLPKRFRDIIPQAPPTVPSEVRDRPPASVGQVVTSSERPALLSHSIFRMQPNVFGLVRQYFSSTPPSHDPEEYVTLADLSFIPNSGPITEEQPHSPTASGSKSQYYPYPNHSAFQLGDWSWNQGVRKSQGDYMKLVGILSGGTFDVADVSSTCWKQINSQLGANEYDKGDGEEWEDEDAADLYHRSLVAVMREKLANTRDNRLFHYEPYQLLWSPPHLNTEVPIYGDLYTFPAFLDAHRTLQGMPGEPSCDLPRVIAGLMFWSDATQLTSFGNTKLWPTYMYFGNESKYRHCKPSCNLSNHVAYFEMLPDSFKDFAGFNSDCTTHCQRELFHEQWKILLDDEFLEVYEHGIVIHCCDGITRRFYPRIFTYSADYPEKVLIAMVRNLGGCPCLHCLIPKVRIQNMGMPQDRQQCETLERNDDRRRVMVSTAWSLIYENDYGVGSTAVEGLLKSQSWVPTSNVFSDRLADLGFNIFHALVVDLLHKFEIGIWKMLFSLVHKLDERYRQTPTFGPATIRKFLANASDLNYLLQCTIPVFDGLLPEPHNQTVMQLLFTMAHWHRLAKLQMHSDLTLNIMDQVTSTVGQQFRNFKATVCSAYNTQELCQEAEARARCNVKRTAKRAVGQQGKQMEPAISPKHTQRNKVFNFQTYKFHALGDYISTIRLYGMSDSYSSEPGELEHRSPKARYSRTDHKSFVKQLTCIECRQARIHHIGNKIVHRPHVEIAEMARSPDVHHHIGMTQKYPIHIGTYLRSHEGDPAIKNFLLKLKQHLLQHIHKLTDISSEDTNTIIIKDDHLYHHNIARFNYTTYDVRRAQDVVNPCTSHCNVMVLSSDNDMGLEGHRFIYGKVLGVYHVNVIYVGVSMIDFTPLRVEFLWVRWYKPMEQVSSWDTSTLDRLRFPPMDDESSFNFVDPEDILRGCHIIPAFARGKRHYDGLGVSACAGDKEDWHEYYINQFVDRDMLMRFHFGLGVGHVYSHYHFTQVKPREVVTGDEVEDTDEEDANEEDANEEDADDADSIRDGLTLEERFNSSNESLLSQFGQMYDSELEVDYEN